MESDKQTHQFKPGSSFTNVVSLYDFDRELRQLVFGAISRIEIALRTRIIHHFSLLHGPFWFIDGELASDSHLFADNVVTLKLKALLAKYPNVDTRAMGFPVDWQDEPLWI
jgi:abortive infection bacteriophage resistance protein